jgi:hypothetical protein
MSVVCETRHVPMRDDVEASHPSGVPSMRRSTSRLLAFGLMVPALIGVSAQSASAIDFNGAVISTSFAPDTVALNGSSIATITVTNPNAGAITNVQFSDTMPAGIDLITQTGGTCSSPATGGGMFSINPATETFSSTSTQLASSQACTITVQVKGTAVGTHVNTTSPVTATNVPPGPAASATLTVTGTTTTTLASSANPSVFGQAVTFTATVSNVGTAPVPGGSVSFTVDGSAAGTVTLDASGIATLTTSALAVGSHPVLATYNGDVSHVGSVSTTLSQAVNAAPPTCDADCDGDGLTDAQETNGVPVNLTVRRAGGTSMLTLLKSDPTRADTDGDGLTDGQEVNGVVVNQKIKRTKGKPKTIRIARYFADPSVADTDGDGLTDGREVSGFKIGKKGFCRPDPANFNTDFAKVSDGFEILREKPGPQNPCRPD